MSKSETMRRLWDEGLKVGEISKKLGCHYSYVYGVIERYVGKEGIRERSEKKEGNKAELFRQMYNEGMTIGEIAKKTNSNYSYVFTVVDKYRKEKK